MPQFQSKEDLAVSIASEISSSAASIAAGESPTLDESSEYPGNSTAATLIPKDVEHAVSIEGILDTFVNLIQSTASEFVAMDNHIAANIGENTADLPPTSAVPGTAESGYSGEEEVVFEPNEELFMEAE